VRENDLSSTKKPFRSSLPLSRTSGQNRSYDTLGGNEDRVLNLNKCGRCRTVISTDTGCVQCRRAQLVINMSRRPLPGETSNINNNKSSRSTINNFNKEVSDSFADGCLVEDTMINEDDHRHTVNVGNKNHIN
jgi:hypothetical protein